MTYATRQDMIDRYGEADLIRMTDRAGALDAIDETVLATALDDAAAEINGYLRKRYDLPLDPVPRILTTMACDIAFYRLLGTQASDVSQAGTFYNSAIAYLRKAAAGEVSLGDETGSDTEDTTIGPLVDDGPDPAFSRDSLKGF